MSRNYFICSVGEKNENYTKENLERCIKGEGHFMHKDTKHKGTFDKVKAKDILILKYENSLISFGEVKKKSTDDKDLGDWCYVIYVDKWYFFDDTNKTKGVSRHGVQNATIEGDQFATIKQIDPDFAKNRITAIARNNKNLIKIINNDQNLNTENLSNQLSTNYNLILTGAPGTGKTYLAKQIAQQMIFGEIKEEMTTAEEKQFNEQYSFVQFHPSYDYTDFVEGLRPTPKQDGDDNIGFELKDGVFKEFCKNVIKSSYSHSIDNFDDAWKKFIAALNTNADGQQIPTITGSGSFTVGLNQNGDGLIDIQPTYNRYYNYDQLYNVYRGLPGVPNGGHDNYRKAVILYLEKNYGLKKYEPGIYSVDDKKYIFIIDEINRGEISKIFGELFFSIDPGYRGSKGAVLTQYKNMQSIPNDFDKVLGCKNPEDCGHFFVPKNVYIIGTMNDIDRSVESMDFAFRRRFAFKEVKATDRIEMLYDHKFGLGSDAQKAEEKMKALNTAIEKIDGLSSAYHIGPAYFLKLKNYNGNFDQLWDNHLDGLLREYMRGMQDVDNLIEKLRTAYNNESAPNN